MRNPLPALLLAGAAFAQEGFVSGPSLGLLHDPAARTLHTVNGMPSAALMSAQLPSADGTAWLSAAPGGAYALGLSSETGQVVRITATGRETLDALPSGAQGVRFSPSGRSALLRAGERIAAVTGLAGTPSVSWEFTAPEGAALSISDDGSRALTLFEGRLTQHRSDGSASELIAADARLAVYLEDSLSVAALTQEDGVLLLLEGEETRRLPLPEGAAHPVAVAGDGSYLLAASAEGLVARLAPDGRAAETISCACAPTTITRTNRGSLYRLNDAGEGPVWLLDTSGAQPAILFIPPFVKEAE